MGVIELDATIDGVLLIPEKAALDVHILKGECILRPNQRWQGTDLYVEIALNQLKKTLRERAVDVFHGLAGRKHRRSESWEIVGAALEVELPPPGGLLDKDLSIADVPMRCRIAWESI